MRFPDPTRWRRLEPLLVALLELGMEDRNILLAQVGSTDPSLATELANLLEHGILAEAEHFLEGTAVDQLAWPRVKRACALAPLEASTSLVAQERYRTRRQSSS